jgi:hypothetical protein
MSSLTVRNIPEFAKLHFRQVAAAHGRSMEEHLRQLILTADLVTEPPVSGGRVSDVGLPFKHFEPEVAAPALPQENWVNELVRVANGAGEGLFEREHQPLREFDL